MLLYGSAYWKDVINFDALVRHGMISPERVPDIAPPRTPHDASP